MSCCMSSNALFKTDFNFSWVHPVFVFSLFNPLGFFKSRLFFSKSQRYTILAITAFCTSELKIYQNTEIHSHHISNYNMVSHISLIVTFKEKSWDRETTWAELSYSKSDHLIFHIKKTWDSGLERNGDHKVSSGKQR